MVESNALLKRRSSKGYRGFESLPLRQLAHTGWQWPCLRLQFLQAQSFGAHPPKLTRSRKELGKFGGMELRLMRRALVSKPFGEKMDSGTGSVSGSQVRGPDNIFGHTSVLSASSRASNWTTAQRGNPDPARIFKTGRRGVPPKDAAQRGVRGRDSITLLTPLELSSSSSPPQMPLQAIHAAKESASLPPRVPPKFRLVFQLFTRTGSGVWISIFQHD